MKAYTSLLALVAGASAHTLMSEIYIDGKAQGDATCIRTPMDATIAVSPVEDLTSDYMACGIDGTNGVPRVCSINGGSTLTFEFREWPDDVSKGPFDIGHYGPCAVYAKKVDDPTTDGAVGDGWFKLWNEGYDETTSKWCTTKVLENNGHLSIDIPDTLQSGYYLIRSELLALHNANLSPPDPQFYVGCAQVFLKSSGSLVPSNTVSIPGYVSITEESVTYNIYASPLSLPYPNSGPSPIDYSSSGSSLVSTTSEQTIGLDPANCIAHNGNWCGVEIEKYTTESAGWAQSKICWTQVTACYAAAPPTGATGCKLMEDKCNNVDDSLNGGTFTGPPNWGTVLDAEVASVSLPAAVNAGSVVSVAASVISSIIATSAATTSAAATSAAATSDVASSAVAQATSAAAYGSSAVASSASAAATYSDVEDNSYDAATTAAASSSSAVADDSSNTKSKSRSRYRKHRVKTDKASHTTLVTSAAQATDAVETVTEDVWDYTTVEVAVYATAGVDDYEKREANANPHHYGHRRVRRGAQLE